VLTFRGNNFRDAPNWGTADIQQKKLEIVWTKDIGAISGTGSIGRVPGGRVSLCWFIGPSKPDRSWGSNRNIKARTWSKSFIPVFDGNIYFLDLATGQPTRDPIKVGYGFKGTGPWIPAAIHYFTRVRDS